ncbi:MAG: 4Fe-4S dicluster domain-containing protein, partial [Deltaproteobacteria bacterium]|nr:4Fe-4S dicluster domain-containing protein [Deltaproteobacteria bacterium]
MAGRSRKELNFREKEPKGREDGGLKKHILKFGKDHGVDLVGFAPVERWDEMAEVPPDFRPRAIWPPARTVIVMGLGQPLPLVETTPSIVHKELYDTTNRELDQLAYDLTRYLNRLGHASFFFPRDGYGSLRALRENNLAAFSHVMAAKYAGLGTIGASHNLLTPEFGPRVRLVSVLTAAVISPDAMIREELCIKCAACAKCCPKKAIEMRPDEVIGYYDKTACLAMTEELSARRCYPCGICTKVCPIGKDRLLYPEKGAMKKYLREAKALAANPDDPEYRSWSHLRKYGVAAKK